MLSAAGFAEVEVLDLTAKFKETQRGWLTGCELYARELIEAEGEAAVEERRSNGTAQLAAIEDGLLRRALFTCRAP